MSLHWRKVFLVCLLSLAQACAIRHRHSATNRQESGQAQFQSYCAACHQYDGQKMGDAPPLAGSAWVSGPESRLVKIVLHGLRGPIDVSGKTYNLEMPGFAGVLSDSDAASLLSFVRRHFGAPSPSIAPETVGRIRAAHQARAEYWTPQELLSEP